MSRPETTHIEGLIAAPFTPMNDDGSVNLDKIGAYADSLHRNGVAGAFVCGTTGEGVSLTPEERMSIARRWVESAPGGFKVIVHVGHNSIEMAKRFAAHAQEIEAWGIGAVGPYYFKPAGVGDLVRACAAVASAAPELPFYYYHIPSLTGLRISMRDFLEAAGGEIPNLGGVKFTDENLMDYGRCLNLEDGRFDMLFGRDEILLAALALGARGAVGSTYNFAAPLYVQMIEAFRGGDLETARAWQSKSMELIDGLIRFPTGFMPAAKSIMKIIGVDCGPVRLPLKRMTDEQVELLRVSLEAAGFFAYASR